MREISRSIWSRKWFVPEKDYLLHPGEPWMLGCYGLMHVSILRANMGTFTHVSSDFLHIASLYRLPLVRPSEGVVAASQGAVLQPFLPPCRLGLSRERERVRRKHDNIFVHELHYFWSYWVMSKLPERKTQYLKEFKLIWDNYLFKWVLKWIFKWSSRCINLNGYVKSTCLGLGHGRRI